MASQNKCFFIGNLTRIPELRVTPKGKPVCLLGLAVNETYLNEDDKEVETVAFLDIEVWGKRGEACAKYLTPGSLISAECKAKYDAWEDRQTQQKRSRIKFVAQGDGVQFLIIKEVRPGAGSEKPSTPTEPPAKPAPAAPTKGKAKETAKK